MRSSRLALQCAVYFVCMHITRVWLLWFPVYANLTHTVFFHIYKCSYNNRCPQKPVCGSYSCLGYSEAYVQCVRRRRKHSTCWLWCQTLSLVSWCNVEIFMMLDVPHCTLLHGYVEGWGYTVTVCVSRYAHNAAGDTDLAHRCHPSTWERERHAK